MIKRMACLCLALLMLTGALVGCKDDGEAKLLSFAQAQSVEEMKQYDGERVTIIGYMSTLSPVSGKFMYLMNLPYQNCPFCLPNSTQLSNTMAVYAKDEFEFTDRAIRVTGVLKFGAYEDEFGYTYSYRITEATYEVLDTSDMSEELRLWQQLAAADVMTEIYTMFEYVYFTCNWATYTAPFESGEDYLYPQNALYIIETEGAQFNYGYKDGYFDGIIERVRAVDAEAFEALVQIIERAKEHARLAIAELRAGKYEVVAEYGDVFRDGRQQYKMDEAQMLQSEYRSIFSAFSAWLSEWEV